MPHADAHRASPHVADKEYGLVPFIFPTNGDAGVAVFRFRADRIAEV
jgi:hypothetical protein